MVLVVIVVTACMLHQIALRVDVSRHQVLTKRLLLVVWNLVNNIVIVDLVARSLERVASISFFMRGSSLARRSSDWRRFLDVG